MKERTYKCPYKYCLHPDSEVNSSESVIIGKGHYHWDCAMQKQEIKECADLYISYVEDKTVYPLVIKIITNLVVKNRVPTEFIMNNIKRSQTYYKNRPARVLYGIRKLFWEKEVGKTVKAVGVLLIDKADIEKAKEKLGDENAIIMAELLDLEKFDQRNLKACCPYHSEDTPSFVYDKKRKRYKCFGCGRSVDVIDVLIEQGKTFLEATQFLFDKANMPHSFGEHNVKTKINYRYPHEEPLNNRGRVIEYLGKRGISKDVVDYLDIREDSQGNCVLNYYDRNDVLTLVKYRPSHSVKKPNPKTWAQKDADTTPLLYNMNRINTSKALLITEGCIDTMSCIEAGYLNTVSVPFGAGNFGWIETNWDWLEQFTDIIIWSDGDEPGLKMRKECIYRLGTWRCRYIETPEYFNKNGVNIPLKDANDCLQIGGREFVMQLINSAKDVPVTSVIDYSEIQELDMSEMDGIKTGLSLFDDEIGKMYYGTLSIISGRPGSGKTSIIDQAIANTIDNNKPVFLFSKEMPERLSATWMNTIMAGRRNMVEKETKEHKKYFVVPYNKQREMQAYYNRKLFIYKDEEPNDIDSVMRSAEECVRKFGCKFIVLDNMMMLDLNCKDDDKYEAQTALINRLIKFATKYNVAVTLIAHPRKTPDNNSDIELYDIAGSSNIINLAMRSFGMRRVSKKEKEDPKCKWNKYDVVLTIMKDRLLGRSDVQIGLWYDIVSRRFYTNYEEYDYQYAWDKNLYTEKIPYVDRNAAQQHSPFD